MIHQNYLFQVRQFRLPVCVNVRCRYHYKIALSNYHKLDINSIANANRCLLSKVAKINCSSIANEFSPALCPLLKVSVHCHDEKSFLGVLVSSLTHSPMPEPMHCHRLKVVLKRSLDLTKLLSTHVELASKTIWYKCETLRWRLKFQ